MNQISIDDVKKLAKLSALSLTDDDAQHLSEELAVILAYVEHLGDVDTSKVEPTLQVTNLETVMREDVIIDYGISREDLLKNTPDQQAGQIKVPRIL